MVLQSTTPALTPAVNNINGTPDATRTRWTFNLGQRTGVNNTCYTLKFTGRDYGINANNSLLNLRAMSNNNLLNPVRVPKRINTTSTNANAWDASFQDGFDDSHTFCLRHCSGLAAADLPCITLEDLDIQVFNATNPSGTNGAISISTAVNSGSGINYTWRKNSPTGQIISNFSSINHLAIGTYCYEVKFGCCSVSNCIQIGGCNMNLQEQITSLPTDQSSTNGEISVLVNNGMYPYTYVWSNGSTTESLGQIGTGTYCVTVTDINHCTATKCINLQSCESVNIVVNGGAQMNYPTSCSENGSIRLLSNSVNGGTAPYKWRWEDAQGNILLEGYPIPNTNEQNIDGISELGVGIYYLVVIDAHGCIGRKAFDLYSESDIIIEDDANIFPACANTPNGRLAVFAYNFDATDDVIIYNWNDGIVQTSVEGGEAIRENLAAGNYCVTVTTGAENACSAVKCFTIPMVQSVGLQSTIEVGHPCPFKSNGRINVFTSGGVPPYRYYWNDSPNTSYLTERSNLGQGTYCVTVSDYCGITTVNCAELTSITLSRLIVSDKKIYFC
ncbi:MAG: SprB repeat-containing protein [Saprospiraceae bacterium]|nr:SprB repeat-containing protein [Saprospiraceae bacterium]